jgi:hypothetical protein
MSTYKETIQQAAHKACEATESGEGAFLELPNTTALLGFASMVEKIKHDYSFPEGCMVVTPLFDEEKNFICVLVQRGEGAATSSE